MQILKVLNRRDAYSVLLAIVLSMTIQSLLSVTYFWTTSLLNDSGANFGPPQDSWGQFYGPQLLSALIQFVAIELFLWLVVVLKSINRPARSSKK
jgi:hypothetical protein